MANDVDFLEAGNRKPATPKGGKRPGSGRKRGSKNKRTIALARAC